MSVALMGNTTVWKPASTAVLSNYYLMRVFEEAGLPPGVVNFVPGQGSVIGKVVTPHPDLAGIHFTGSNATFNTLWRSVTENLKPYRSYPRLVGETGGKDFIFVHASSDPAEVATAIVRGAFEYQGQKCSAASRAYIPRSLWPAIRELLVDQIGKIRVGDVTDFRNFVNAVIDEASFDNIMGYIARAKSASCAKILAGGTGDKSVGYFVSPTVIETTDPHFVTMEEEIFGPVLAVVRARDFAHALEIANGTEYGLTGAVYSQDRQRLEIARREFHVGNLYFNRKCTGALVDVQPFGGFNMSGTDSKAGGRDYLQLFMQAKSVSERF